MKNVPVDKIPEYEKELFEHMANEHSEIIDDIRNTKVISPDNEEKLRAILTNFAKRF